MAGQIHRFISDWEVPTDISLPKSFWHEDRRWHLFQSGLSFNESREMLSFARKILTNYTDGDVLVVIYSYIFPKSAPVHEYPGGMSLRRKKKNHPLKPDYFLIDNIHAFYIEHAKGTGKAKAMRSVPVPHWNFGEKVLSKGVRVAVGCGCSGYKA
jgi:hypothetical protein